MDAACETIHGLSAFGHVAVSSLRPGCSARLGRSDLGKLLSSRDQCRLLDEGRIRLPTASTAKRTVVLVLMLVLVLGSGIYFIGGKFRSTNVALADSRLRGDWQAFTPERLQAELEQGHSVFVDFTAAWCLTCKFNEANVLESSEVRDAFQRHAIVKLKADWTNGDPAITNC